MKRVTVGLVAIGLLATAAWQGVSALQVDPEASVVDDEAVVESAPSVEAPIEAASEVKAAPSASTAPPPRDLTRETTALADRVAVLGLLNKRNGVARDIAMKPGQAIRVGDVVLRLKACETTAPWENQKLTGAFVQVDVRNRDSSWKRAFSGWLFKESPSLNVVEHPIYDVWPKSCTMVHPDIGPETVRISAGAPSIAKKSAAPPAAAAPEPVAPDAASSNPI